MTLNFKTTYLKAIRERYFMASKAEKSLILDELCEVTGYNRKWAIRVLAKSHKTGPKISGRKKQYSEQALYHLKRLWHILGRINSKKMVAAFPVWLDFYDRQDFNEEIRAEIMSMSHATIDRYLQKYRNQFARRKRTGTQRAKTFLNTIPIKEMDFKSQKPGSFQADTVAHCGNSLSGTFIWSLTVTDEYSGWTENRAIYGKNGGTVTSAFASILWSLPFKAHQINTDNGTEFINDQLQKFLVEDQKLKFTRSRAYKKNDNAHVEQKNFTHVRELFGYDRFDKEELTFVMNEIYKDYFNVLWNFFIPQQKCIKVERVGSRYRRAYDIPKTPYQRLIESSELSVYQKEQLKEKYKSLNPIELKRELNDQLARFKRIIENKSEFKYKFVA